MRIFRSILVAWICVGCGGTVDDGSNGKAGGSGGDATGGRSDIGTDAERKQACAHWLSAQSICATPVPPSETARLAARFVASCNAAYDQAGASTAKDIEACAAALEASSCESSAGPPVECRFRGSLPAGAPCISSTQCETGACKQTYPLACGTCAPSAALGQLCDSGCSKGAACLPGNNVEHDYRCTTLVEGDVGATCDDLGLLCKPGLYCGYDTQASALLRKCFPLGKLGERCTALGAVGCVTPLQCVGSPPTCQAPMTAGGSCSNQVGTHGCATGLGCDNGVCKPITWAEPGEPCDGVSKLCRLALCPNLRFYGETTRTCPSVVADGMPCTTGDVCDAESSCVNDAATQSATTGICKPLSSVTCQ